MVAIVSLASFAPPLLAQDWPRWRGPQSNGVGAVSVAPERWSATEGVAWRAAIEGYGISSPVSVGNRVYLTTAITSERRTAARLACDGLIACLALFGIPAVVRHRWVSRMMPGQERFGLTHRAVQALDLTFFTLLAVAVLGFGTLVAIGPKAIDFGLNVVRDVGVEIARLLGRHQTNLWFLDWDEGTRHNIWIVSSAMALVSLALIPFLVSTRSPIRVAGAVALAVGVALAALSVPWGDAYGGRFPPGPFVVLYGPVAALAAWHLLAAIASATGSGGRLSTLQGARWAGSVPALLSLALFVSPNYVYQREMVTRRLVCLDANSGERLWHADVLTTPPEAKFAGNSHATPTPSVAGDAIVASFGPGLAAFDLNGQVRWSKTFPDWIDSSIYGAGSSPVSDEKAVFLTTDREYEAEKQSRVVAYSLDTGRELWNNTPRFAHDGYATPVVYDDGARKLLVTVTSKSLVGYLIDSGAMAWRLTIPVPTPIPSPVVEGGRLYVTGGKGGNGYTAAYRLPPDAPPDRLWTSRQSPADVSSPVLYKGRLFTITSTGIMVCYDAESGEIIWRRRVGTGLGVFYASLAAADGKVYAARSNGTTYVIAAEDTFRLISESSLPEEIFASPGFGADCLLLRTTSALYCIGGRNQAAASDSDRDERPAD